MEAILSCSQVSSRYTYKAFQHENYVRKCYKLQISVEDFLLRSLLEFLLTLKHTMGCPLHDKLIK